MSDKAALLLILEQYRPLAIKHLTLTNIHNREEADQIWLDLTIWFWFPLLAEEDRRLLRLLKEANWCVSARANAGLQIPDESEKVFLSLVGQVKQSDFYNGLSPVQNEILEDDFFSLKFK